MIPATPPPTSVRRTLLKVLVKSMFYVLLFGLLIIMSRAFLHTAGDKEETLHVNIGQLATGGSQGIEWKKRRFIVVRPGEAKRYRVFVDADPFYGCALLWVKAGDTSAPLQPWPGGLRAICVDHWYDQQGTSLDPNIADLRQEPFHLEESDTLVLGAP